MRYVYFIIFVLVIQGEKRPRGCLFSGFVHF